MKQRFFHSLIVMLLDLVLITAADGLALLARFDFSFDKVPDAFVSVIIRYLPIQLAVTVIAFLVLRMYSYLWRSISSTDAVYIIVSVIVGYGAGLLACWMAGMRLPRSVYFLCLLLQILLLTGMRCSLRLYRMMTVIARAMLLPRGERIMVIGGGAAGRVLVQEITGGDKISGRVSCVIDDNPGLWGKHLDGVPVVGGRERIQKEAEKRGITQIIFAIPTATAKDKRDILELCQQTGCKVRTLPGIFQMVNGEVSLSSVQDVRIEDLLGREPVTLNQSNVESFLRDRVVLVTGGGGSIGSELCRQIARFRPEHLILLDIYENNAYEIQQELRRRYGASLRLTVEIASIRDKERIRRLFHTYRPEVVFHAAAHKHVPLMEDCPMEAVKNNIFGTYHVVQAAEECGVEKFVMISTDKAVNPTNFMGATKRFCEMILQSRIKSETVFCAVRFGNVLGSNGSVIPLFQRHIQEGGPVTVTDKRIIRYFMTIPEASQLVLEAGSMAERGQIFVLDMGEPVKILTLAEKLIRLSGYRPYQDIEIREIGLRPGEKLFEDLLMNGDGLKETNNQKIFVEQQEELSREAILSAMERLSGAVQRDLPREQYLDLLKELVPTYRSPEEVNRERAEQTVTA